MALAVLGDLAARRRLKSANRLVPKAQQQVDAVGRQREIVTALGLLPNLQRRFGELHDQVLVLQRRAYEQGGLVSGAARSARLLIQAGVMALGALLVLRTELTPGGMIAASILLSRALAPIEQMLSGWRSWCRRTRAGSGSRRCWPTRRPARRRCRCRRPRAPSRWNASPTPWTAGRSCGRPA